MANVNQMHSGTALFISISYTPQYLTYLGVFQVSVYHILLLIVKKLTVVGNSLIIGLI